MPDTWKCSICSQVLRCSCQSQECGFDHEIKQHVRRDLRNALSINASWWELQPREMLVFVKRVLKELD